MSSRLLRLERLTDDAVISMTVSSSGRSSLILFYPFSWH